MALTRGAAAPPPRACCRRSGHAAAHPHLARHLLVMAGRIPGCAAGAARGPPTCWGLSVLCLGRPRCAALQRATALRPASCQGLRPALAPCRVPPQCTTREPPRLPPCVQASWRCARSTSGPPPRSTSPLWWAALAHQVSTRRPGGLRDMRGLAAGLLARVRAKPTSCPRGSALQAAGTAPGARSHHALTACRPPPPLPGAAVLIFAVLESKMSQPRNFIGGQFLSAIVGSECGQTDAGCMRCQQRPATPGLHSLLAHGGTPRQ